jgi:hypothetical protein
MAAPGDDDLDQDESIPGTASYFLTDQETGLAIWMTGGSGRWHRADVIMARLTSCWI